MLFIIVKWQSVYDTHRLQMPSPGRCVTADTFMLNYGATNMAPTHRDQPILSSKKRSHLQTHKRSWNALSAASTQISDHMTQGIPHTEILIEIFTHVTDTRAYWGTYSWKLQQQQTAAVSLLNIKYIGCSFCRLIGRPQHLVGRQWYSRQSECNSLGDHLISRSIHRLW
jgi:hypothetical protein